MKRNRPKPPAPRNGPGPNMNDHARFLDTQREYEVLRWQDGGSSLAAAAVAEEVPIALVYNGIPHVVMMASPADLEEFALGFSLSEGILRSPEQLYVTEITPLDEGVEIRMDIDLQRFLLIEEQHRNLAGRTGCGLCGAETIGQAVRHPAPVGKGIHIAPQVLQAALGKLAQHQALNARTGAVHAAAWATAEGELMVVREDVGRHNALDKMIGALARRSVSSESTRQNESGPHQSGGSQATHQNDSPRPSGDPFANGFALITSRASFEMAQKAATVGITVLAAISAPTGLAIRLAQETGLTLIGFARAGQHNVYANPHRLEPAAHP
jgi:FdhD protein